MYTHFNNNQSVDPKRGGYSDIRMWPCYMALSLSTLFFAQWLGIVWSFLIIGLPVLLISIKLAGLHKSSAYVPKESVVYKQIRKNDIKFDKDNKLLRKNTKILSQDEQQAKILKKEKVVGNTRTA